MKNLSTYIKTDDRLVTFLQMKHGSHSNMADRRRNWLDLPSDLTKDILRRIGAVQTLESAQKVCTSWRKSCKDPSMWIVIDMNVDEFGLHPKSLDIICRHAVDRSEGQLIDISIGYFFNLELLRYIADCSSKIRRLQVLCHCSFCGDFGKVVKKLPLLEELSLNFTGITGEDIKIVGRSCPRLKSFDFNNSWQSYFFNTPSICDREALAIAESMPNLLRLQLIGNRMTDRGLKAILDHCDQLESLDLRLCKNLNFEGSLGKRCAEQIKDLKRPNDSLEGHPFIFVDNGDNGWDFLSFDYDGYDGAYYDADDPILGDDHPILHEVLADDPTLDANDGVLDHDDLIFHDVVADDSTIDNADDGDLIPYIDDDPAIDDDYPTLDVDDDDVALDDDINNYSGDYDDDYSNNYDYDDRF